MKSLVFFLCFITLSLQVNAKWNRIVYDWECINLNDLQIFNDNLIVTVGDEGLIRIAKDNSGANWENIFIPDKVRLLSVACPNNTTIIAGSEGATIYRTSNFGLDWVKLSFPDTFKITIIKFKDENIGFFGTNKGTLYRTSNGGESWEISIEGNSQPIYDISISNEGDIYVSGKGNFLQSKDNGNSWSNIIDVIGGTEFTNFYRVKAVSNNVIFAISDALRFYRTNDGGLTWTITILDSSKMYKFYKPEFAGFEFFDESKGIIRINDYSQFMNLCEFSTKDGGKTFAYNPLLAYDSEDEIANCMRKMTFKSDEYGFSCGSKGQTTRITINHTGSSDFFRYEKKAGKEPKLLTMVSGYSDKNFAILNSSSNVKSELMITSDAGISWKYLFLDTLLNRYPNISTTAISYPSPGKIFITAKSMFSRKIGENYIPYYKSYIFKTEDCGNSFTEYTTQDTLYFFDVTIVNTNYGFYNETNSDVSNLKFTMDGGTTWNILSLPKGEKYIYKSSSPEPGVFFLYIRSGVSGNYTWKFFRTYDYGNTWTQGNGDNAFYTMKLHFIDRNTGFGISRARKYPPDTLWYYFIWKTTDAGDTWQTKYTESSDFYGNNFNDISVRGNTILTVRDYNYLCISKDLGETWVTEQPPQLGTDNFVEAGTLLSPSHCIAVAPLGYILYNDELVTSVNDEKENLTTRDFIFPNPATDYIEVNEWILGNVSIHDVHIYNVLGECVMTIIRNDRSPEQKIDISILSTGIYFLKIGDKFYKFVKL